MTIRESPDIHGARRRKTWGYGHRMSDIDPLGPEADRLFAEQLAMMASTYFEMGKPVEEIRSACIEFWRYVHSPAGMFTTAAELMGGLPQPLGESAEKSERMEPIRKSLGMPSVGDQLAAMLAAWELLEELGREFG